MQILQIFCKEYIFIYIYILNDKIQAIEWQTLNVFQFVVQVQNIWCCRPLCGHHPGRVENFSFFERRTSLCREKLHGHVARTHHHLTMVVVEMGFVLEWMTYDKYGSNGMGEGRPFQRDLDRASFGGGEVLIFRVERELKRGRKRWVVRNRDDWKKKKKNKAMMRGWVSGDWGFQNEQKQRRLYLHQRPPVLWKSSMKTTPIVKTNLKRRRLRLIYWFFYLLFLTSYFDRKLYLVFYRC